MLSEDLFNIRRNFERQMNDHYKIHLGLEPSILMLDWLEDLIEQAVALENAVVPDAERQQIIVESRKVVSLDVFREKRRRGE